MRAKSEKKTPSLEGELQAGFPFVVVAGVDEVGRGCLVGPVVTAAVILPADVSDRLVSESWLLRVRDSKLIGEEEREELAPLIQGLARAWSVAEASPAEIDSLNIHHATLRAMARAIQALSVAPAHVLVDGKFPVPGIQCPSTPMVKGDQRSLSIACASILAKVHRDRLMHELEERFPGYDFGVHKGYPTPVHLAALAKLGPLPEHRKSFGPVRACLAQGVLPSSGHALPLPF